MARLPSDPLPEAIPVETGKLLLDSENPRLSEDLGTSPTQRQIAEILAKRFDVEELALSIAANGYFQHEPLYAEKNRNGTYTVIEGNRRLCAVKLLLDRNLQASLRLDFPTITSDAKRKLEYLPVVETRRRDVWQYLGFKHVNGPAAWSSEAKARYIAYIHEHFKVPLDEIARQIGDRHTTVQRLYQALSVLHYAEANRLFSSDDRFKPRLAFSHLYTGLGYPGFRSYLDYDPAEFVANRPVKKSKHSALRNVLSWLYGSQSQNKRPLVETQNPDLRRLDEVLSTKEGAQALENGAPLAVALQISKGDARLLSEGLQEARLALQKAYSAAPNGYGGDIATLERAKDVQSLAEELVTNLQRKVRSGR